MNGLQIIMKSCSASTLWIGAASVAAGCASATAYGYMEIFPALLCFAFAFLAQCTGNIGHRYYDEKNGYGENLRDGMSYEDDEGRPVLYCLSEGLKIFSGFTILAGLGLLMMAGWWTLLPGVIIIAINWLNNHGKYPWSRSLFYPIITFILFGPVTVIATDLVISWSSRYQDFVLQDLKPAIVMSIVMGFMAFNCHIIFRASHAMLGIGVSKSFTSEFGVKVAAGIIATSTLIYTAVLSLAPVEISIYTGYGFLVLPAVSLILSFISIYLLIKNTDPTKAWNLSLVNIVMVGVTTLVIFSIVGYPSISDYPHSDFLDIL